MVFKQAAYFFLIRKRFTICVDGLMIETFEVAVSRKYFVPFEKIGHRKSYEKVMSKTWLIVSIFFAFSSFYYWLMSDKLPKAPDAHVLTASLAIASFIVFLLFYKSVVYLSNSDSQKIEFLKNKPSTIMLDNFISELLKNRDEYLKRKYAAVDPLLSYSTQASAFRWLRDNNVITDDEYESLKHDLDEIVRTRNLNVCGIN